jgi:hypothetical protein
LCEWRRQLLRMDAPSGLWAVVAKGEERGKADQVFLSDLFDCFRCVQSMLRVFFFRWEG